MTWRAARARASLRTSRKCSPPGARRAQNGHRCTRRVPYSRPPRAQGAHTLCPHGNLASMTFRIRRAGDEEIDLRVHPRVGVRRVPAHLAVQEHPKGFHGVARAGAGVAQVNSGLWRTLMGWMTNVRRMHLRGLGTSFVNLLLESSVLLNEIHLVGR